MDNRILDEISSKIRSLISNTPAGDVDRNLRAMLAAAFAKLDLVTREEFDVQREVLLRAREKITRLENRVAELERIIGRLTVENDFLKKALQHAKTILAEPNDRPIKP